MTSRQPDWDDWRAFGEVMRDGSLSGAARRLGLSQPTVGRHIDALEAALGLALFARSPRGLAPTDAAHALAPHVEAMAAASAALQRVAAGEISPERGVVRLAASEIVGCEVLPPILARFRATHPDVAIELVLSNRNEDLARRDADMAVRMVRPTQKALVARKIGDTHIGLFAHRDYLDRFGTPLDMAELRAHRLIGWDRNDAGFRSVRDSAPPLSREDFIFRSDSDAAQLAALRAGFAIGGCQLNIARRHPELVRLFADYFSIKLEIWLVMHEDIKSTPRARALYECLAQGLLDYVQGR